MPKISEVISFLGQSVLVRCGSEASNLEIKRVRPFDEAGEGDLSFLSKFSDDILNHPTWTRSTALIVPSDSPLPSPFPKQVLLISATPRLHFIRTAQKFFTRAAEAGIHPSAIVAKSAKLHPTVSVGALSTVGANVEIGEGSSIGSGVHIYADVIIGRRVVVNSGTVIGADGFGYERNETGDLEKFPHFGNVIIEDDVEIGANTCIDRGALGATLIGRGVKIDNLVHIAHNVKIGEAALIIAHAMVAGSVVIGREAWISPSTSIRDKLRIGEGAIVGMGAVVTKDVPHKTTVAGNPARELEEQKRILKALNKLS